MVCIFNTIGYLTRINKFINIALKIWIKINYVYVQMFLTFNKCWKFYDT